MLIGHMSITQNVQRGQRLAKYSKFYLLFDISHLERKRDSNRTLQTHIHIMPLKGEERLLQLP